MKRITAFIMTIICLFSLFTFTGVAAEPKRPAPVKTISTKVTETTAAISWKAVKGASGYRFYMWNAAEKKWNIGLKETTELGVEISKLTPGKSYKFAVKSYTKSGKKTLWSKDYTKVTILTKPVSLSKITATPDKTSVKLTWKKAQGATSYRIYQYNSSKKTWKALKSTSATSYTVTGLTAGKKYTFAVRPYAKAEGITAWAKKRTTVETATKPLPPKNLKGTATTSSVKLTWSKSTGATGYKVYIRDTKNNKWKTLISSTSSLSANITKLSSGKKYTFAVKPYIKVGSTKIWGEYAKITVSTKTAATTVADAPAQKAIYRTATGSKYHYLNPCGNGKYYKITLAEAKKANLEPCAKCVG